jgi:hypothetical protein
VAGLLIAGGWSTFNVNDSLDEPSELVAVTVIEYEPPAFPAGVPARVAVPSPLSVKVIPAGRAPVSVRAGVGVPTAVIVLL